MVSLPVMAMPMHNACWACVNGDPNRGMQEELKGRDWNALYISYKNGRYSGKKMQHHSRKQQNIGMEIIVEWFCKASNLWLFVLFVGSCSMWNHYKEKEEYWKCLCLEVWQKYSIFWWRRLILQGRRWDSSSLPRLLSVSLFGSGTNYGNSDSVVSCPCGCVWAGQFFRVNRLQNCRWIRS